MKSLTIFLLLLTFCLGDKPNFNSYESYSKWVNKTYKAETVKPQSSLIHKMKYFPNGQYMQIFFKTKKRKGYLYQNVNEKFWKSFKEAKSKGAFYNQRIKNNHSIKIKL